MTAGARLPRASVPALTMEQMREVDRIMVDVMRIDLVQMMENAGRSLADLAISHFNAQNVVVLAGPGGNGGVVLWRRDISPTAVGR